MLKAAQALRVKAQNLTGYATGVVLCLWLALNFLSPAPATSNGFDLPGSVELTDPLHIPVGTDTSEGAEDDAAVGANEQTVPLIQAVLVILLVLSAAVGRGYSAFSARAPPV